MHRSEELRNRFAGRLRTWRKVRDLSQRDIARAVSVSPALVNRWEQGQSFPSRDEHYLLADFLGMVWEGYRNEFDIPEQAEFPDHAKRMAPAEWLAHWLNRQMNGPSAALSRNAAGPGGANALGSAVAVPDDGQDGSLTNAFLPYERAAVAA